MKRFTINIAQGFGEQLWGREEGRRIRDQIIEDFLHADYHILILDFIGVSRIDFSCASEIVSVLILRISGELKGKQVMLSNLSSFVEENINAALEKAELCCIVIKNETWKLIGKFSDSLVQTIQKLIELKKTDTPTLSNALQIAIPSCNNRLKTLLTLGMIKREEVMAPSGGIQYIYFSII